MIAIIPARGGSKGLPGKNVKPLKGKPLLAYTVEAAMQSSAIDEVVISTDSEEIAEVAMKYGATCPFMRPEELASDNSMAVDTYIYTIDRLARERGKDIDSFVVLLPTSPLRIAEDIDNAVAMFNGKHADSVISYCEERHPIRWHKHIDDDGHFEDIFEPTIQNRQEYKPTYYPNGSIYVFRTSMIRKREYYTENSFAYIMPHSRSMDIDTLDDFEYVSFILSKYDQV